MSFTNFIKRPVLSTVVSIFFVLLGIIGGIAAYRAVSEYRAAYHHGNCYLYGCRCPDGVELCRCSAGGEYQRCGEHDLYDLFCV